MSKYGVKKEERIFLQDKRPGDISEQYILGGSGLRRGCPGPPRLRPDRQSCRQAPSRSAQCECGGDFGPRRANYKVHEENYNIISE